MPSKQINTLYRTRPLARVVLLKMYFYYVDDHGDELTVSQIKELFDREISSNLLTSAVSVLYGDQFNQPRLVTRQGAKVDPYRYKITQAGIEAVERALLQKNSDLAYFREHGDDALDDVAGLNGIFFTRAELDDLSEYTPVELDRSSDEFEQSVTALEAVVKDAEKNNRLAAEFPSQKEGILQSLNEGLQWLKEKRPTLAQIRSLLVSPLKWLATTFGKETLGHLAKMAAQKILDLISGGS